MKTDTLGIDHIGLTVGNLSATRDFFTDCLLWDEIGGNADYPAAFVSDGHSRITLWQRLDETGSDFDRRANIGLHHLALKVGSKEVLDRLYTRVSSWPGVVVEFAPEPSGKGPKIHFMILEPGGTRMEFAFDPR